MKKLGMMTALTGALALSACASAPTDTASRNAPLPLQTREIASQQASFKVTSVRVSVPETLTVSEANRFYPGGDIVWREDPPGDRRAQVKAIVEAGMMKGIETLAPAQTAGQVPVLLDVEVTRFHALTEKARYTVGGVHALQFKMMLRDPETGAPLGEPKFVKADFKALGGQAAVQAEQAGQTQKVRITDHLARVIRQELTSPVGHRAANLGLMGAINQL